MKALSVCRYSCCCWCLLGANAGRRLRRARKVSRMKALAPAAPCAAGPTGTITAATMDAAFGALTAPLYRHLNRILNVLSEGCQPLASEHPSTPSRSTICDGRSSISSVWHFAECESTSQSLMVGARAPRPGPGVAPTHIPDRPYRYVGQLTQWP